MSQNTSVGTIESTKTYVIQGRGERNFADCVELLSKHGGSTEVLSLITDEGALIQAAKDADALVVASSQVTRRVMTELDKLKVVVRTGVGFDVIDVAAATELGVIVVNIPDLWVREVANHAVGLMLALNRKITILDQQVRAGNWSPGIPGEFTGSLHGETLGIVGLGNIGTAFARRMAGFEMTLIGCDPYVDQAHFDALGVEKVDLVELAKRADYISVHTLLNEETTHLIGDSFLAHTKPNAILINTSRGPVVDEQALHAALIGKRLAGAALDVWEKEPVDLSNPLMGMENVIATPHSAFFSTPASAQVPLRCAEEIARALRGEQPINVVNREIFDSNSKRRAS